LYQYEGGLFNGEEENPKQLYSEEEDLQHRVQQKQRAWKPWQLSNTVFRYSIVFLHFWARPLA